MKILTLQFLTCAIKSCKSKTMTAQPLPPPSSQPPSEEQDHHQQQGSPFPLHPRDASLERTNLPFNPLFVLNILPRIDWTAIKITATELGLVAMLPGAAAPAPEEKWEEVQSDGWREKMLERAVGGEEGTLESVGDVRMDGGEEKNGDDDEDDKILKGLHTLLLETEMVEGKLVCGSCGHEYEVKEGVGNFLLPAHLV